MAKLGLIFDPLTGEVVGHRSCSRDSDLALQPRDFVEVAPHTDEADVTKWARFKVQIEKGRPVLSRKETRPSHD